MKKQALIVFGEYRTFETVSKFWNIPQNFDVFISTWDWTNEKRCCWVEFDSSSNDWEIKTVPYFNSKKLDLNEFESNPENYFLKTKGISVSLEYKHMVDETMFSTINPKSIRIHPISKSSTTHNTANMIYHWKSALNDVLISDDWNSYENIFMVRTDAVHLPITGSNKSMFDSENLYNLDDKTIYSPTEDDSLKNSFFNDVWIYGNKESMKTWIEYLDMEKHKVTHEGLAIATNELIGKKILKHKSVNNNNHVGLYTLLVRRGTAKMWDMYFDKWRKNNFSKEYLPISHPNYSKFESACNIEYKPNN